MLLEATNAVDTDFTVRWRLPMTVVGLQTKHRNMLMDDAAEPAAQITTPVLKARCLQAIRQDNLRAVRVLLETGVDTKLRVEHYTTAENSINRERERNTIANILLSHCPEAPIQGSDGTTALRFAALYNMLAICELLLNQYRVDVDCPSLNTTKRLPFTKQST